MIPTILVLIAVKEGIARDFGPVARLEKETGHSERECMDAFRKLVSMGYLDADLTKPGWWKTSRITREGKEFLYDSWCEFAAAQWAGDVPE
ncbi:MAG: hypothetical protein V4621_07895 [Pseudomonadota bacterium]